MKKKQRNSINEIPYETIREYLDKIQFDKEAIKLDQGTTITDQEKFYIGHCGYIDGNRGNKRYRPYYDRLVQFYNYYKSRE